MSEPGVGDAGLPIKDFRQTQEQSAKEIMRSYLVPQVHKKDPRMISVGCQFGFELNPFMELFPEGSYKGVDIDREIIGRAQKTHAGVARASFETQDARDKSAFGDQPWDIVFLRHPQVLGSLIGGGTAEDWEKIIANSVTAISDTGVIFASAHSYPEASRLKKQLEAAGLRVFDTVNPNPTSPPLDMEIIIARK